MVLSSDSSFFFPAKIQTACSSFVMSSLFLIFLVESHIADVNNEMAVKV